MDSSENTFPMDVTDPSSRPWKFRPGGYLVVVLASSREAQQAETTLVAEGFAARDIKLYTGKQILDSVTDLGAPGGAVEVRTVGYDHPDVAALPPFEDQQDV